MDDKGSVDTSCSGWASGLWWALCFAPASGEETRGGSGAESAKAAITLSGAAKNPRKPPRTSSIAARPL